MKTIFVTYASGRYKKNIFWNKFFVNLFIRPDITIFLTDDDLKQTKIYTDNRNIFDSTVGAGYWAWKPWVISKAIESASEGDIILYQDCGKGFKYKNFRRPAKLLDYAIVNDIMPGVLVPIHGENRKWTHTKCFKLMDCSDEKYYSASQVEASVSVWKVGEKSKEFVNEWLSYCLDINVVGDSVDNSVLNDSEFISHRYDQSILTNLVIKRGLKPIRLSFNDMHFSKSMSLVDLELGRDLLFNKIILAIILNLFRAKRFFKMWRMNK